MPGDTATAVAESPARRALPPVSRRRRAPTDAPRCDQPSARRPGPARAVEDDQAAVGLLTSITTHPVVPHAHRERLHGLVRGQRHRDPGLEVEARAVPRTDDDTELRLPLALAERPVVVARTRHIDGDQGARRQLLDRRRRGRPAGTSRIDPDGSSSSGSDLDLPRLPSARGRSRRTTSPTPREAAVPFARWSATLSTPSPSSAHFSRTGVSGIPISSRSSSFGIAATSLRGATLHEVGEHRGRGLADRAAATLEADLLDHRRPRRRSGSRRLPRRRRAGSGPSALPRRPDRARP